MEPITAARMRFRQSAFPYWHPCACPNGVARRDIQVLVVRGAIDNRKESGVVGRCPGRILSALRCELESLDADLDDQIRASPFWRVRERLLASVQGMGLAAARTLLAQMPEPGRLDRRQITVLAGLAPWTRQSGTWKGRCFVGSGRNSARGPVDGRPHGQPPHPELRAA